MVKPSVVFLSALLALGCASPRTEILIVTGSDFDVPGELDQIEIEVRSPDDVVQRSMANLGPSQPPLPRVLGLYYETGALGPYLVTVTGRSGGSTVVTREAEITFIRGATRMLRLDLLRSCEGMSCRGNQTCGASGCRSRTIDPEELEEWTGAFTDGSDAGVRADAGQETMDAAGPDSGAPDAGGPDTGTPDAGSDAGCVVMSETCNDADDDCDGRVDEDFDLDTDSDNCGSCGNTCGGRDRCCTGTCRRSCG